MRHSRTILLIVTIALTGFVTVSDTAVSAAGSTFYVDCATGSDSGGGTSSGSAWRSITRANQADLGAGDTLRLKRGCTWNGQRLDVEWSGTASSPVTVATFGSGSKPLIRSGRNSGVKITGRHVVVSGLSVDFDVKKTDPCGQPLGQYYGFNITGGASHVTVTDSEARHATAGLHVSQTAGGNHRIIGNVFAENNVMTEPFDGSGDLGAWGVLMRGDDSEIAYNRFQNNVAVCIKGTPRLHGNSVELYEARNNHIHHNTSIGDRVFSELGSSSSRVSSGNRYSFNTHTTSLVDARFITTRGADDEDFGPVNGTVVERNTIRYTGAGSEGLVCVLGCTPSILTARFNIIDVVEKSIFFDGSMGQTRNLLWSPGDVLIQDGGRLRVLDRGTDNSRFIVADPRFVSATDLRLRSSSPAVDRGGDVAGSVDHSGGPDVVGSSGDIGADEYDAPRPSSSCSGSDDQTGVPSLAARADALCRARRSIQS